MKIPRQTIIFQENLNNEPIQVNADNRGDVIGTIAGDISKELYSRVQVSNQEMLDKYPGIHWWAKDLEMFVPYLRGEVAGNGTDGGVKMFFIDTNTTVGKQVFNAFTKGGGFSAPGDIRGDNANIKKYFGSKRAWLPQADSNGTQLPNVNDATDYMIYSGQMADEIGGDPDGEFHLLPSSPLSPPIYEHTSNGSNSTLKSSAGYPDEFSSARAQNYGPCQYQNNDSVPKYGSFMKFYNTEQKNTFKNFIDDDANSLYHIKDFYNRNPGIDGPVFGRETNKTYRNSVVPYVRDIIVQSDTHVCGGYFHTGTYNAYQDEGDNERIEDAGAFGRKIQNHPFNDNSMSTVFEKGAAQFSESAKKSDSFYGVVITTAHLHNELVGDDQTDANWYLALVKKSVIADFLENREAQNLVLEAGNSGIKNNITGLYNSKKQRMAVSNLSKFRNAVGLIHKRDNYGKGDESTKWGGDDKRSPRAQINGIVISFRKPNPTTTNDKQSSRGNVDTLNYPGSYTIGPNSTQEFVLTNEQLLDEYRFLSNSYNQLSRLYHKATVDFGLFDEPGLDKNFINKNYTPIPYTYNINNNEPTINQIYYDTSSPIASQVGVPATVGLSYDIALDGIRLDKSTFQNIDSQGDYINDQNIGFKFAILDEGKGDEEFTFENAFTKLDGLRTLGTVTRTRKQNLYNFTDIFLEGDEGIEYGTRTVSYTQPGLKELTGVIFMYHKRPNGNIQPIKWWVTKTRLFLNYSSYYVEDFSEIGGPGFNLIPYPVTTPIVSGLSKRSKYFRSLDNIVDADQFSLYEVTDKSRCNAAIRNNELGQYIGDSDLGQVRMFSRPVRIWEQLGVEFETDIEGVKFYYDDLDHYDGGGADFRNPDRKYPQESIATEVFISNTELKDDCIVELNPGIQTFNMLRDSSGNENKGILLGDYKLAKDDEETPLTKEGTMKVAKVSNQDRAY